MEAPVKFKAPSLTLSVGVDVGRTVFWALNRVEIVLAFVYIALCMGSGGTVMKPDSNPIQGNSSAINVDSDAIVDCTSFLASTVS
jgi:hypothetical protein